MLIAIGPMGPLAVFLQVLCWIILPALLLVFLCTTLHHYARKRKNAANALAADELTQLTLSANNGEGAYLFFDHTGLIRDYKKKLSYSHARYTALKNDFDKLEEKYKQGRDRKPDPPAHLKTKHMETIREVQGSTTPLASEECYLKDLVEEKRAEVAFLQAQLEQRIRRQHEAEEEKERFRTELRTLAEEKEQLMRTRDEQVAYAELQLAELKQQNELLNAAVADGNDKVSSLVAQLEEERSRVLATEQKLQSNKQLLQRLYKEFAACVEEETGSAVVAMQPAYLNSVAADY